MKSFDRREIDEERARDYAEETQPRPLAWPGNWRAMHVVSVGDDGARCSCRWVGSADAASQHLRDTAKPNERVFDTLRQSLVRQQRRAE